MTKYKKNKKTVTAPKPTAEQIRKNAEIEQMTDAEKWDRANEVLEARAEQTKLEASKPKPPTAKQYSTKPGKPGTWKKANKTSQPADTKHTAPPTAKNKPDNQKTFFQWVNLSMVKSTNQNTLDILQARANKERLNLDETMIVNFLNAIKEELTRLNNCRLEKYLNNCNKYAHSIADQFDKSKHISFKQFVALFNIIYGLSKCRNEDKPIERSAPDGV